MRRARLCPRCVCTPQKIYGRACSLESSANKWTGDKAEARVQNRKVECPVPLGENVSPIRGVTSVESVAMLNLQVMMRM